MTRPVKKKSAVRRREIATLVDPKTARKFARDAENALIDLEERIGEKYAHARTVFLLQDAKTRDAIERMADLMHRMAGDPIFRFNGVVIEALEEKRREIQTKGLEIAAVRLFTACALWDIQIANFKLPADVCAKCGKKPQPRRRKKNASG